MRQVDSLTVPAFIDERGHLCATAFCACGCPQDTRHALCATFAAALQAADIFAVPRISRVTVDLTDRDIRYEPFLGGE